MCTYKRHRFPPEIISYAVWLYFRFNLSHRDIEDLLAQRGINVSYESVRCWCLKFGPKYAKRLRKKHRGFGDTFFVDEVFIKIRGKQHYLWRAVDQDGEVVDVLLQTRQTLQRLCISSREFCDQLVVRRTQLLLISSEVMVPLKEKWVALGNMIRRSIRIISVNSPIVQLEVKSGV